MKQLEVIQACSTFNRYEGGYTFFRYLAKQATTALTTSDRIPR